MTKPMRTPTSGAFWLRIAVVCTLLVISGALRSWQVRRERERYAAGRESPFALKALPLTLGRWSGADATLDPQIARRTAANDAVFRRYVDQATGTAVEVIVLHGPPLELFVHTPENCYDAAGYTQPETPGERIIEPGGLAAPFRTLVFKKGVGAHATIWEVYYAWRYLDRWTPEIPLTKHIERVPGIYKVQVARLVTERERRDVDNPCESLLELLVPEIEHRCLATEGTRMKHG
jgi:hypothetical protein